MPFLDVDLDTDLDPENGTELRIDDTVKVKRWGRY